MPPLKPGVRDVEHRVDDVAKVIPVFWSSFERDQRQRFQYLPLGVSQITRIGHGLMVPVNILGALAKENTAPYARRALMALASASAAPG
jgi:hypothetical protein